jgi:hypothetical protein
VPARTHVAIARRGGWCVLGADPVLGVGETEGVVGERGEQGPSEEQHPRRFFVSSVCFQKSRWAVTFFSCHAVDGAFRVRYATLSS